MAARPSGGSPADVKRVREPTRLPLIAKIEKPQAVQAAEEIIRASDCVMVARGDLGIELQIEEVPMVQKHVIATAGELAPPGLTPTPTLQAEGAPPPPPPAPGPALSPAS